MFAVTTAATDLTLLTLAELRAATGANDASQEAALTTLGARVAAVIADICRVPSSGVTPPTLRLETLTETFRLQQSQARLMLSRFPIVSVASIVEDTTTLVAADYEIHAGSGMIQRLSSDVETTWPAVKIVVVYQAGWATVPDNLKLAAAKLAGVLWSESQRIDPNLKREAIPGVMEQEWWVGPSDDPAVPDEILQLLSRYMNPWVG